MTISFLHAIGGGIIAVNIRHGFEHNQETTFQIGQAKMCGILCSIWNNNENEDKNLADIASLKSIIERRGPDSFTEIIQQLPYSWKAFFGASVLWMQGPHIVQQPCVDSDGNILLWNGDIFSGCLAHKDVSDTQIILDALRTSQDVTETLKSIRGPYSIIYYQAKRKLLYFARDPIGRHSLLIRVNSNCNSLTLSSSTSRDLDGTIEVPAIGIFIFNLETSTVGLHPWRRLDLRSNKLIQDLKAQLGFLLEIFSFPYHGEEELLQREPEVHNIAYLDDILISVTTNKNLTKSGSNTGTRNSDIMTFETVDDLLKRLLLIPQVRQRVDRVLALLKRSIKLRVKKKPKYCKNCIRLIIEGKDTICNHAKIGILFSGGLDSTLIAALTDNYVPKDESIELINVAFEKRKIVTKSSAKNVSKSNDDVDKFDVPDRKTARQALIELREICPWREWKFVECNVTQNELEKYRSTRIRNLVYPLETVLDDSLGCALWFASRASGFLASPENPYDSLCRVLLLGMGADELFGGYTRHRTTLRRGGWTALSNELDAELARISERNLGRDDRIVSDHGRQSRLPYLDEDFVEYVTSLDAWERCYPVEGMPGGLGDKLLLRLVAHSIGLRRTATFPKRAFQFGSRIANSKDNAKDVSKWL